MQAILYNNASDENVAFKKLSAITEKDISPYGVESLEKPQFLMHDNIDIPLNVNYIYIPDYGRYYFCRPELMANGEYIMYCECDTLCTYLSDIAVVPCIIDREAPHNDLYIDAGTYVKGEKTYNRVYNFSNGFSDTPQNILICCGGERSVN